MTDETRKPIPQKSRGGAWSKDETRNTVKTYFKMLALELNGEKFVKAKFRRELVEKLDNRSEASVEMKFMNISGYLASKGRPYIKGYKPMANFQKSIADYVEREIELTGIFSE